MIDAVFALVLILGVVFGAKRGLFRSFMALAAIVLALIGAVAPDRRFDRARDRHADAAP